MTAELLPRKRDFPGLKHEELKDKLEFKQTEQIVAQRSMYWSYSCDSEEWRNLSAAA